MTQENVPPQQSTINLGTLDSLVNVKNVHLNLDQDVIITTEDKIRIHLSGHINKIEKKKAWIAPLGIFLTIIIALLSAEFKSPGFLFPPDTWRAIFIISFFLSGCWLAYTLKDARESESIDDLIKRLKTGSS